MQVNDFAYTPPEPLILEFGPPVKVGNGLLERLALNEPAADQVKFAEQHLVDANGSRGPRMYARTLVSKVGKVPEDAVSQMPMRDFQRAIDYLQRFVQLGNDDRPDDEDPARSFSIMFDPPFTLNNVEYPAITVREPTLEQMMKADTALKTMSPQHVRMFQINLVAAAAGENPMLISKLPISVLNRAATFCMGFTRGGQAT